MKLFGWLAVAVAGLLLPTSAAGDHVAHSAQRAPFCDVGPIAEGLLLWDPATSQVVAEPPAGLNSSFNDKPAGQTEQGPGRRRSVLVGDGDLQEATARSREHLHNRRLGCLLVMAALLALCAASG